MTITPNILLVGPGGVGAIVAYGLQYTGKAVLSVVVRGDYEKVSKDGFEIKSPHYGHVKSWKPVNVYPTIDAAAKNSKFYDYVVISTKNLPDITKLEDMVEPVITPAKTTIVLVQNGFGIDRPFISKYPKNICLSGISHIGSSILHGVVTQKTRDENHIGYFLNENLPVKVQEEKAKQFIDIYSNEHNTIIYCENVKAFRYQKLVYNACFNTICALTGLDTSRLYLSGSYNTLLVPAMREVVSVAKADGITLRDDVIDYYAHISDGHYYKPSMQIDVEKGNPIEVETILGNLIKVADSLQVPIPTLKMLYSLLHAVQFRLKEGRGIVSVPESAPVNNEHYS
ncbi:uncharacterized protein C5L36_0B09130 [Pichia kudriavzevii]|mgnify:CR=1 FL=1|uniref:2-dehydropantoate 2-reductase n=1 Tax=Pichia kudriavzevii TaxID=4909 RepID=A0A099P2Y7_PICKU|nr:uncharacterized protein C5L36_0B09130 [Pichia kudriavzevii]AWU75672.1 hypothetical protein C5L36_0B09130 [Pichia kudriavzevii]KGK39373.1 hypothetical protein JL09_g1428 [Pichia kudriavzevii]MDC6274266.1 2-dehydropantoate 2-reductase [Lacticaseibacillus paracasei]ONH77364.1 Meiotically up-regulated gene 72 protein [Pichia kudriavzevii]